MCLGIYLAVFCLQWKSWFKFSVKTIYEKNEPKLNEDKRE